MVINLHLYEASLVQFCVCSQTVLQDIFSIGAELSVCVCFACALCVLLHLMVLHHFITILLGPGRVHAIFYKNLAYWTRSKFQTGMDRYGLVVQVVPIFATLPHPTSHDLYSAFHGRPLPIAGSSMLTRSHWRLSATKIGTARPVGL